MNNEICLHLFTVFYLVQPSSKQIICFGFRKQNSVQPIVQILCTLRRTTYTWVQTVINTPPFWPYLRPGLTLSAKVPCTFFLKATLAAQLSTDSINIQHYFHAECLCGEVSVNNLSGQNVSYEPNQNKCKFEMHLLLLARVGGDEVCAWVILYKAV